MINLLVIETSNAICSVGLRIDGNRFIRSEHVDKRHNERLLPMLNSLREEAGLNQSQLLEELDGVAFGCGPGSFTGVRIAAAAAQALALASDAAVFRVSSSQMLALKAVQDLAAAGTRVKAVEVPGVITAIRSRRDVYYLAAYRFSGGRPIAVLEDALHDCSPEDSFYRAHSDWLVAGSTPEWWQGTAAITVLPDAASMFDLADMMAEAGEGVDVAAGLPEYLSGDSPWRKSGG